MNQNTPFKRGNFGIPPPLFQIHVTVLYKYPQVHIKWCSALKVVIGHTFLFKLVLQRLSLSYTLLQSLPIPLLRTSYTSLSIHLYLSTAPFNGGYLQFSEVQMIQNFQINLCLNIHLHTLFDHGNSWNSPFPPFDHIQ